MGIGPTLNQTERLEAIDLSSGDRAALTAMPGRCRTNDRKSSRPRGLARKTGVLAAALQLGVLASFSAGIAGDRVLGLPRDISSTRACRSKI